MARQYLGGVAKPRNEVSVAEVYLEGGDRKKAREHALSGYPWAWADGPAYPNWWELKRCRAVLAAVGEPEPKLPDYDPAKAEPIPCEAEIKAHINALKQRTEEASLNDRPF